MYPFLKKIYLLEMYYYITIHLRSDLITYCYNINIYSSLYICVEMMECISIYSKIAVFYLK